MKNKKPNAEHIWKQFEDLLVPRLRLSVIDRAVYSHLLRHSRLEGRFRLRFSIARIARGARLGGTATRRALRRLVAQGALRVVERGKAGHLIEVRLPEEIRAVRPDRAGARDAAPLPLAGNLEETDFLKTTALRESIHARERGFCFYCLRRVTARAVSRPCHAAGSVGLQYVPQPRLVLSRVQFGERGTPSGGFSPQAVPRAPPDRRRTCRPAPRPRRLRLRQTPASSP